MDTQGRKPDCCSNKSSGGRPNSHWCLGSRDFYVSEQERHSSYLGKKMAACLPQNSFVKCLERDLNETLGLP
jgi:hypothetical protein